MTPSGISIFFLLLSFQVLAQGPGLPRSTPEMAAALRPDWLVEPTSQPAGVFVTGKDIILENGLVRRTFREKPNLACTDYSNLITGQQLLRAVKPEASVVIDGKEYRIGGLDTGLLPGTETL